MTGRIIGRITGLDISDALVLTSNGCRAGVFCLFGACLRRRSRPVEENESELTLFTLALFPPTLYMRMGYSESTFLFVVLMAMYTALFVQWYWFN